MQFSTTSDYAIRTVLYLALNGERSCTANEIEKEMAVPSLYLSKVTKQLRQTGILEAGRGNGGGYRLIKDPEQISLYDILSLTEQTMEINGCLEDERFCSRCATATCPVRRVYAQINATVAAALKETTVSQLMGDTSHTEGKPGT